VVAKVTAALGIFMMGALVASLFIIAATAKLWSFAEFQSVVAALGFNRSAAYVAAGVVATEVAAAFLLLWLPPAGAALSLGLLACFALFAFRAWTAGTSLHCSCFGRFSNALLGPRTILRNGLLGIPLVALLLVEGTPAGSQRVLAVIVALTLCQAGLLAVATAPIWRMPRQAILDLHEQD
jgi:hypothetical protein